jgi:ClpP class serine protease
MAEAKQPRRNTKSFGKDSPFMKLQSEVGQLPKLRQKLIADLERIHGGKVLTFFTSFSKPAGMIIDMDAEMMESVLAVEKVEERLLLVLNSPGGQGLAAERIVNVCRSYSGDRFEVLVPHMAKSAATMICFGARKIHMSKTAELGPVDPQFAYKDDKGNDWQISASEYVRSYEDLLGAASDGKKPRIEAFLQQLQRYDSRLVEQLRSAQSLSGDISVRLLKSTMMSGKSKEEIAKAIEVFLVQDITKSHGRMITFDEAKACGLNVQTIDLHSPSWNTLWELYYRSNWLVTNKCSKLIESRTSTVHA